MTRSKSTTLCFLLVALVGTSLSTVLHIHVMTSSPADSVSDSLLDFVLFPVWLFAISSINEHFGRSQNWLRDVSQLLPLWTKLSTCCIWVYGTSVGLMYWFVPFENRSGADYWLQQSSAGSIVLYSTATAILYAIYRHKPKTT